VEEYKSRQLPSAKASCGAIERTLTAIQSSAGCLQWEWKRTRPLGERSIWKHSSYKRTEESASDGDLEERTYLDDEKDVVDGEHLKERPHLTTGKIEIGVHVGATWKGSDEADCVIVDLERQRGDLRAPDFFHAGRRSLENLVQTSERYVNQGNGTRDRKHTHMFRVRGHICEKRWTRAPHA
jgi:hypothetical protein